MLGDRGFNLEIEEDLQEVSQSKPSCNCCVIRCLCNLAVEVKSLPRSTLAFYKRLSNEFSWRFVAMVSLVYGINQGLGEGWYYFAEEYYLNDAAPKGLGLQWDQIQQISVLAYIPWKVQPVYGIISDTFPIGGLQRTPYIVLAGVFGFVSWLGLAIAPPSFFIAGLLFVVGNISVASPDVMIDAAVAERCRKQPRYTTDLQTLCWVSFGFGGLISSVSARWLYHSIGTKGLFVATSFTAVSVLYPAIMGWLKEKPKAQDAVRSNPCVTLKLALTDSTKGPIYKLALSILLISIPMGIIGNGINDNFFTLCAGIVTSFVICCLIYKYERRVSMRLAKASMFIFLGRAIQPQSYLLYSWSRENEENCFGYYGPRPCFPPSFFSILRTFSYVIFILGTAAYNKYLSNWSYKKIWAFTQMLLCANGMLVFILVKRWNLKLGISDYVVAVGDELLYDVIMRLNAMPLFSLTAAVCPEGVEATLFAMNMGLFIYGETMGFYMGNGLMWFLGDIEAPEYKNIDSFMAIASFSRLLPIMLIPCLAPEGSPASEGNAELSQQEQQQNEESADDAAPQYTLLSSESAVSGL